MRCACCFRTALSRPLYRSRVRSQAVHRRCDYASLFFINRSAYLRRQTASRVARRRRESHCRCRLADRSDRHTRCYSDRGRWCVESRRNERTGSFAPQCCCRRRCRRRAVGTAALSTAAAAPLRTSRSVASADCWPRRSCDNSSNTSACAHPHRRCCCGDETLTDANSSCGPPRR